MEVPLFSPGATFCFKIGLSVADRMVAPLRDYDNCHISVAMTRRQDSLSQPAGNADDHLSRLLHGIEVIGGLQDVRKLENP